MPKIKLVLLAFFFCVSALAQEKMLPLKSILDEISRRHRVTFNYIEDELVVYRLLPPKERLPLQAKLDYLKKRTRLEFVAIGSGSYAVVNDQKLDKPLCGFLRDSSTGNPIEAASVVIQNTMYSTVSDANGYFELPVVSPNTILVSHQNYEQFSLEPTSIYRPDCPDVPLIPIINNLDEIVAKRFLTTGISKNDDGTFGMTPKKFGILPGQNEPDVHQTMQQLPGIDSEDETISNISVRGGTHDQNLFLWNGIRIFQTGHFFGLISAFNPALAHRITISKNGTNAFFGESVSSLVDISTHAKTMETSTVVSADLLTVQAASSIKLSDDSSIGFSLRRSYTDMFTTPTYHNYRRRIFQNTIVTDMGQAQTIDYLSDEHFYFYDFTMQYRQRIGRHDFSLDAIGITNSLIIDQFSEAAEKNNDLHQNNYGVSAVWNSRWDKRHQSIWTIYVSQYNLDASVETFSSGQLLEQTNKVLDKGLRFGHFWDVSPHFHLNGGYQFNETGVTNSDEINSPFFSRNITAVARTHVAVAETEINPNSERRFLKLGFRMNYFENLETLVPEFRLQYSERLGAGFRFELLGEQKSQTMSQVIDRQQDFLGIEKRRWTLVDGRRYPLLQSDQLSIGVTYRKNNWLVSLDNFYKKVTGITTSEQGFQNQFEFVNESGEYRVLGSELLVQKNFGRYYAWLNYSVNDNRYEFESLSSQRFPNNFELIHSVAAVAVYEWQTVKVSVGAKWHSGRPVTTPASPVPDTSSPLSPQILYNEANNSRLPDFFQMNFSAVKDWQFSNLNVEAGISIINVLDAENVVNRFYRISPDGSSVNRIDTYALERTPNLHLKIVF